MELAPVYVLRPNSARLNASAKGLVTDTGPGRSRALDAEATLEAILTNTVRQECDGAKILEFPVSAEFYGDDAFETVSA